VHAQGQATCAARRTRYRVDFLTTISHSRHFANGVDGAQVWAAAASAALADSLFLRRRQRHSTGRQWLAPHRQRQWSHNDGTAISRKAFWRKSIGGGGWMAQQGSGCRWTVDLGGNGAGRRRAAGRGPSRSTIGSGLRGSSCLGEDRIVRLLALAEGVFLLMRFAIRY